MEGGKYVRVSKRSSRLPESLFMISCSFWTRDRTPGRRNSPSLWEAVSLMYCRALVMHGATARPVWRSRDVRDEPNTPFVSVSVASTLSDDVINSLRKRIAFQVAINSRSVRHWLELRKFRIRVPTTLQNSFSLTFPWLFQTKWIIFPDLFLYLWHQ